MYQHQQTTFTSVNPNSHYEFTAQSSNEPRAGIQYMQHDKDKTQRFPVQQNGSYGSNEYEFRMTTSSNYKSPGTMPENIRMVDSDVATQQFNPANNRRTTTKVVHERLDDGTVISRQIVVEEDETFVERRLYKYEPTSPIMNRRVDPAQAMAVQTGLHQAADFDDGADMTEKFNRYEADLMRRRQQTTSQNGHHSTDDGRNNLQDQPVPPTRSVKLNYNESFKHASSDGLFSPMDQKPSPRPMPSENPPRSMASENSPRPMAVEQTRQSISSSAYTYDFPGGNDQKKSGNQGTRDHSATTTTTHGFPLFNRNMQKSTPDVFRHAENDYDNAHMKSRRDFKMSLDNLDVDEEIVNRKDVRPQMAANVPNDRAPISPRTKPLPGLAVKPNRLTDMVLEKSCGRCLERLQHGQDLITNDGDIFHVDCFVCSACFSPFPNGIYFDFDGRKYCEEDFNLMFAPSCVTCGEFVKGRVIKAMGGKSWHPDCFTCARCETPLADIGFHSVKSQKDKAFCKPCSEYMMKLESGRKFCGKCHAEIENDGLQIKNEWFHAYHFNCAKCNAELTPSARASDGKLYCLKCSDSKTCALCRRTIEKYERSLLALNKNWHPDCFRCSFCDKPFNGEKHFVYNAQPYCEDHYNQLFGNLCFYCNRIVPSPGVAVEQKIRKYCEHHFECFFCAKPLSANSEVCMLDGRPVCMKCTQRFPGDFKGKNFRNRGIDVSGTFNPKAKLLNPFKKK